MSHNFVLPPLSRTSDVLTLSLLYHFLAQFLLQQVLEMPQTAVHVEVGGRVLLRAIRTRIASGKFGAHGRLEWRFERALRGFAAVGAFWVGDGDLRGEGFLEAGQLLIFESVLDLLHMLAEAGLQVLHFCVE